MRKILFYSLSVIILFGFLGANTALARGWFSGKNNWSPDEIVTRYQTMFENEAKILGISVDEYKAKWAEGKNFWEIAKELGLTKEQIQAKIKEMRMAEIKTQLQILVEKGIITQNQADQRLKTMENWLSQDKRGKGWYNGFRHRCFGWF